MGEGGDSSDPVGGVEIAKPSKAGAVINAHYVVLWMVAVEQDHLCMEVYD